MTRNRIQLDLRWSVFLVQLVAIRLSLSAAVILAQDDGSAKLQESQPAGETVVAADIDAGLKQVEEAKDLDDATKATLQELYAQAKVELEGALKQQEMADRFKSWIASAEEDIANARHGRESPPQIYDMDAVNNQDLNQLVKESTALEQQLADAKKELSAAQREPQRRIDRKVRLPEEINAAQAELTEVEKDLEAIASASDPSMVLGARSTLLLARRQLQLATVAALQSERDAYESQGELPRLRIDLATARVRQLEQSIQRLGAVIAERRKLDAAVQRKIAERALQAVPEELKPYAQSNIDLVNRRFQLARDIREAVARRDQIDRELKRWQRDFSRTRNQADTGSSDTIGLTLIRKRDSLPSVSLKRRHLAAQEEKLRVLQNELYQLEDRRDDLSDIDDAVKRELLEAHADGTVLTDDARPLLKDLFNIELPILDSLLKDANQNHSLRIAAKTDQEKLVGVLQEYSDFIDARVFRVRCAAPLGRADVLLAPMAIKWLANIDDWREARESFITRVQRNRLATGSYGIVLVLLFVFRRRIRSRLEQVGRTASDISCREMLPTSRAMFLTALLAAPWPLLAWGIGWGLSGTSNELVRAVAVAFSRLSIWLLTLESIRQICCPYGLGEAHFGWSARGMSVVHSSLRVFAVLGAPIFLLTITYEFQRNTEYRASVGRLALVALLLLIAWTAHRLFRPKSGVLAETLEQNPDGWLNRWRSVWCPVIVLIPFTLVFLAIIGFQYTSTQLAVDLWRTFVLVFSLCALGALMHRWVRIQRRRLRWRQLMEARQRATEEEDSETSDLEALAAREEELDLVAMHQQTRRLINTALICGAVIGLSLIWSDVFGMLTPLIEKQLWTVAEVGGGVRSVTVGALLLSALSVALVLVASRNIPGVVDVVLHGRLGIESSTRYAVSTLSQYAIVLVGVLVACFLIGFTWGRAQWLIAALSVGLGFGLQEVVANFVCGIILLFERPIRVGDTVTLGETTGVVIRIRSRATTVRNWDRQEVVIPNKELITGRIVNWTLTDDLNRVVIQVGIAYGSDTNHARDLLRQIAEENSNVVDDPRPLVTFEQFGDSTLNFSLRAYLANMDQRLETIHDLHTSINQRFAEEGIEIAFPQRDLHIRSTDQSVREVEHEHHER